MTWWTWWTGGIVLALLSGVALTHGAVCEALMGLLFAIGVAAGLRYHRRPG
jgi:hypothetical protein